MMQWFSLGLLNRGLPQLGPADTPVIVETTDDDLELTFATTDNHLLAGDDADMAMVKARNKVSVFGRVWDLVTVPLGSSIVLSILIIIERKVCLYVASFETFGSGSFGGPLGVQWVLVVLWGSGGKIGRGGEGGGPSFPALVARRMKLV